MNEKTASIAFGAIGRRKLLAMMMCSAAAPALGQALPGTGVAAPDCDRDGRWKRAEISFAGARQVLLLIHDSEIAEQAPRPVSLGAPVIWKPDPTSRSGGAGSLDGIEGVFSARRHIWAPQLFRPWPTLVRGSVLEIFDKPRSAPAGGAPADDPATWSVVVAGEAVPVVSVHRKTLPVQTARTDPRSFANTRRHLVTLGLESEVPVGARVTVSAPGLEEIAGERSNALRSELVHVCQAGYPIAGTKKAYVGLWLGTDKLGAATTSDASLAAEQNWRLVDAGSGEIVAQGGLAMAKPAGEPHFDEVNFNGCDVYEADFSDVRREGSYRLEVDGIGASFAFPIAANPYAEVLRLAARWYYQQRSGCAILPPYGEGRARPRNGHPNDGLTVWQTEVQLGRTSEGFSRQPNAPDILAGQPAEVTAGAVANPDAWGGWHDAGDWDRRVQHLDVVWLMANLVESYPTARELDMNIPESGRPFADPAIAARRSPQDRGDGSTVLPDLIHEALWGISLWRRTQTPEGGIIGGVEYSSDGITGSVSWNPIQNTYAYAPEEWTAYYFAMAAAKLGHVIETVCGDATLGAALKAEAEAAWAWAEAEVAAGSTGDDEETVRTVRRTRMRAAASLYRATGNPAAREAFERYNVFAPTGGEQDEAPSRALMAHVSLDYVRAGEEGREVLEEVAAAIVGWSAGLLSRDQRLGADYGLHNTALYPWGLGWYRFGPGSNWRAGHAALHLAATGEADPLTDIVLEGLWFGLGCNPSNTSFVQGLGARDFADALLIDLAGLCPVPGQISFGVAGGGLRRWELGSIAGALYPEEKDWPRYARIFESSRVVKCAEHGITSNAREWLQAAALANELLALRCQAHPELCDAEVTPPT